MNSLKIIFLLLFLNASFILAQEEQKSLFQSDTVAVSKRVQILGLPIVFYTPETSFGGGGGLQLFFHHKKNRFNERVSNIFLSAIYTAENQLILNALPQIYLYQGRMFLDGEFLFKLYPNSFWGIGGNTPELNLERYNMQTLALSLALLNSITKDVNFGFEYEFKDHIMLEVTENGLLDTTEVNGSDGARTSGLAFVFNFDDRDNIYSPFVGNYLSFKGGFSSKSLGATYSYNNYLIDLRKYFKLFNKHTLAIQAYLESAFGTVPFQSMAWLGGPERNRGYFKGRYIANNYLLFQSEFRIRFHKRFNLNLFAILGQVSKDPKELFFYPKLSYGGGIRFQLLKSNPTLIRVDIGINQYGGTGLYFGVNEAF